MSSFNGSGTFQISGVGLPYTPSTTISSSVANQLNTDFATGLSTCITKDGQTTITANIPLSGFKITSLGTGTASNDAAAVYNVQASSGTLLTVSGTDTIVGSATPALSSSYTYVAGMTFRFFAAGTNTGTVTLNVDGRGAKAITKNGTNVLVAGDIPSGILVTVTYDGTQFVLSNQSTFAVLSTGTLTVSGNATIGGNASVGGTFSVIGKSISSGGSTLGGGNTLLGSIASSGFVNNGLLYFKNSAGISTTLNGTITSSSTTIALTDSSAMPSTGTILIDNEQITYGTNSANTLGTLTRGANGTTAAAHTTGALVSSTYFASTTLSANIDNLPATTTIPVTSAANFPNTGTVLIDSEQISYTGKTSVTLTGATRAVNGTTIAAHTSGVTVSGVQLVTNSSNFMFDDVTQSMKLPNATITNLTVTNLQATNSNFSNSATFSQKIQPITATTAASALTVTLNPTVLDFRSTTLTSGAVTSVSVTSAISLIVASGATLGSVSSQAFRLVVLAINNAGTVELAIVNLAGSNQLDETNLISTTALSGTSNTASVIYSTTSRSNVAYKVVGFIDFPAGTAGTWATITEVQGTGGQPLAALSSLGYGQSYGGTWASGTTYYNTYGKPIFVSVCSDNGVGNLGIYVNGVQVAYNYSNPTNYKDNIPLFAIVPPGNNWSISGTTTFITVLR
ncbi:MAG: beta strand repeat-containing protein [Fluviibacter sp.]